MIKKYISLILLCLFFTTSCYEKEDDVREISLYKNTIPIENSGHKDSKNLTKIAISTMISPKETFIYYVNLLDYISKKLGRPVELVQRKSYKEINDLLKTNEIDAAFICSGAYVEAKDNLYAEILVVPVVNDAPHYFSYIIVSQSSKIESFKQLRGKSFAFVDPLSNTGRLYPLYLLYMDGLDDNTFFSKVIYTYSHDRSIDLVKKGLIDGAAVDSLVWDYAL